MNVSCFVNVEVYCRLAVQQQHSFKKIFVFVVVTVASAASLIHFLDRTFLYDLKSFKSWKFSFRRCYAQCKQRSVEDFKFKIFFFSFLAAMANDGSSSLCLRSNQRHKKTKTETLSVLSGVWGLSSFSFTGDGVT